LLNILHMFIVTGLGNPSKEFENTPHNAGYMFVDQLREFLVQESGLEINDWSNEKRMFLSSICKIKKDGELIGILQKPLTYMNSSGSAVKLLLNKFPCDQYILAHDDLDMPLGRYKIQFGKSPKSHKGVLSVESALGDKAFLRVRVGVDNRGSRIISGDEYVLMPYTDKEIALLKKCIMDSILDLNNNYLQL